MKEEVKGKLGDKILGEKNSRESFERNDFLKSPQVVVLKGE